MSDINNVKYTLFGHNGDQYENEKKFNEPLLNINKTQNIYLYRVRINGKKKNTYGMVNMKLLIKILNNILVKITI